MTGLCEQFPQLKPLFAYGFCVPASSAPVERVFSQSGLMMRPNRARMTDAMLEILVLQQRSATVIASFVKAAAVDLIRLDCADYETRRTDTRL